MRLLRLAGADRVTLRLPDGIRVETRTVYRAVPEGLAEEDRELLRGGGVVALHSGAAAERLGVDIRYEHEIVDLQIEPASTSR